MSSKKKSRKLSESVKKTIAARQRYQCANKPGSELRGLKGYDCKLWKINDEYKGNFDEYGYEIDHIIEYSISANDKQKNLQALCKTCHGVKTKRFSQKKCKKYDKNTDSDDDTDDMDDTNDTNDMDETNDTDDTDETNEEDSNQTEYLHNNAILIYECKNCFKKFPFKGDYIRHLNRKRPCKFGSNVDTKAKMFKCKKCGKNFTRKDYLQKHVCKSLKVV